MGFSFGVPEKVTFDKARCGDLLQTDAYINGEFVKEELLKVLVQSVKTFVH